MNPYYTAVAYVYSIKALKRLVFIHFRPIP